MNEQRPVPRAEDFMTSHVCCVSPEMSLGEIVDFLKKHEISNAPVVEEHDGKKMLVGFISEADCLEYLANEVFFGSPSPPQSAATFMRRHPICIAPETELFTIASIFINHRHRHLPVVKDGVLLGVVSRRDILEALDDYYRAGIRDKDRRRHPPNFREIISHRFLVSGRE
jgi:CBS domain-containing protein